MTRPGALRRLIAARRGAVAIEFAVIALPLTLLLAGTIEISRYTWTRVALQDAASAGARCLGLRLAPCVVAGSMDAGGTATVVRGQARDWSVEIATGAVTPEERVACEGVDDFARVAIRHRFGSVLAALPDTWIEVEACFPVYPPA